MTERLAIVIVILAGQYAAVRPKHNSRTKIQIFSSGDDAVALHESGNLLQLNASTGNATDERTSKDTKPATSSATSSPAHSAAEAGGSSIPPMPVPPKKCGRLVWHVGVSVFQIGAAFAAAEVEQTHGGDPFWGGVTAAVISDVVGKAFSLIKAKLYEEPTAKAKDEILKILRAKVIELEADKTVLMADAQAAKAEAATAKAEAAAATTAATEAAAMATKAAADIEELRKELLALKAAKEGPIHLEEGPCPHG